jgi:hypothetical protein
MFQYTLLKLLRMVRYQYEVLGFILTTELTLQLLNTKWIDTLSYRRASLCGLPNELSCTIIQALGPVDRICLALTSKHLVQVANFAYLTIPTGKVTSKAGLGSVKGSAQHVAAQEIWNELIGERLMGSWVPRTLHVRTSYLTDTIGEAGLLAAEARLSQE